MFHSKVVAAVLISVSLACSGGAGDTGGDAGSASRNARAADGGAQNATDLPDPCVLVTDKEFSDQLWEGMASAQRPGHEARNSQFVFEKRADTVDFPPNRGCYYQHKLIADTTVWSEGDFIVRTLGRQTFDILAESRGKREPIPGVGDDAFYMGNAAYGRRGDVAVEVQFAREGATELLKAAMGRLP